MQTEDGEFVPGSSTTVCAEDVSDAGMRLDRFLASRIETLSRARLQDLIREGHVQLSGKPVQDPNRKVREGDRFEVTLPEAAPYRVAGRSDCAERRL